ncbi:Lactoylglutathione lyase @ Cadmium-induced protein CadI [Candidatus Phaeomarinobacter ectocarpi]|uniref:Lactoylglutathione lyase @ Cadmium-induced protein CadI n=1 Tax=Candidatus Phaeomarinibacter ectocarpi TaxID=1458461 RepID=X5M882_9HYPH|nr:ArsI/CadI family heavy metal resistance metalloenzyme [Candidatus Phaeomarinobacter ectocarpi]CDO59483.1 Lactoylglutathione lyase @ Cadmium-induced protein CadI [Candidatus Phaeomarinobacter ectocarpi]
MNRLHVSVTVPNIEDAKTFYAAMFGADPTVVRPGYAKWMLDDPRVNFVANEGSKAEGVDHLGIQTEDEAGLHTLYERFEAASDDVREEGKTECCFAKSEKSWVTDPAGLGWEAFLTSEITDTFGDGPVAQDDVISTSREGEKTDVPTSQDAAPVETYIPTPIVGKSAGCC